MPEETMTEELPPCPECHSPYVYPLDSMLVCPECNHEWNPSESVTEAENQGGFTVRDANGALLSNGDSVVLIKSLPVKGAPKPIKIGTKVSNIRLEEGDHNISCKISGFGAMMLKSEFVKKA